MLIKIGTWLSGGVAGLVTALSSIGFDLQDGTSFEFQDGSSYDFR